MTPTKRQIAKAIRQAARITPSHVRMTSALFAVCKTRGNRASAYYDGAVRALKAYSPVSFTQLLKLPTAELQKKMRRAARALEHGLRIDL